MTISLPEERALLGKGEGQNSEPLSLDVDDDDLHRYKQQAQSVEEEGVFFTNQDLHRIVARLVRQQGL